MDELDALFDEMAEAEDDMMEAKRRFEKADEAFHTARIAAGFNIPAYLASRSQRGLKP